MKNVEEFGKRVVVKRAFSLGFAVTMAFSGMPLPALAEAVDESAAIETESEEAGEVSQAARDAALGIQGETVAEKVAALYAQLAGVEVGEPLEDGDADAEALAALKGEASTARGVTHAFALVAAEAGIEAVEVTGANGRTWCMTKVDGVWRHVDPAAAESASDASWLAIADDEWAQRVPDAVPWTLADGAEAPRAEAEQQSAEGEDQVAGEQSANTESGEQQLAEDEAEGQQVVPDESVAEEAEATEPESLEMAEEEAKSEASNNEKAADEQSPQSTNSSPKTSGTALGAAKTDGKTNGTSSSEKVKTGESSSKGVSAQMWSRDIREATVAKIANQAYTGKAIKPSPKVTYNGWTLVKGTDYTLSYKNNTKVGTATVTITGKGSFEGTKKVTFKIVAANVQYYVHRQNYGDEPAWSKSNGAQSGTVGESKRLEAIWVRLAGKRVSGSIQYNTHIQRIGWQGWKSNGAMSGTQGMSRRLEGIRIRLTGNMAKTYDVYYRVHAQKFGWMGWAKNGANAGTAGYSYRLEAIQIVLVAKGGKAPAKTYKGATQQYAKPFAQKSSITQSYESLYDATVRATALSAQRANSECKWLYYLFDIDGNGVKELIVSNKRYTTGDTKVYTVVKSGNSLVVKNIGSPRWFGGLRSQPIVSGGKLYYRFSGTGGVKEYYVMSISGGKVRESSVGAVSGSGLASYNVYSVIDSTTSNRTIDYAGLRKAGSVSL
ncbi:MAG: hypothetical protein IKG21_10810 [Atopobiaceae bacterium]|nr:hypothetical protein [Atopobiaceae bacterium]